VEATRARVKLDELLGIGAFSLDRILANEPDFLVRAGDGLVLAFTGLHAHCLRADLTCFPCCSLPCVLALCRAGNPSAIAAFRRKPRNFPQTRPCI
jgi:hypothetical protein